MKLLLNLFLYPLAIFANIAPLPQKELDPQILSRYLPQIMEELTKEFELQDSGRTRRATREYGYSFFKMEKNDFDYSPPPAFLQELGFEICKAFGHEPVLFTNIILSYYGEGFFLEPHVDVGENDRGNYPFYFSENVYGLVVEPDATGHLHFVRWDEESQPPLDLKRIYELSEKAGTIFCLQGPLRKSPYFHAVSQVTNRRVTLTFRTLAQPPHAVGPHN